MVNLSSKETSQTITKDPSTDEILSPNVINLFVILSKTSKVTPLKSAIKCFFSDFTDISEKLFSSLSFKN